MLTGFAEVCDVVTFEFENLPADAIAYLAEPQAGAPRRRMRLQMTQDRLDAKRHFVESLGLQTAPFFAVSSAEQARESVCQDRRARRS